MSKPQTHKDGAEEAETARPSGDVPSLEYFPPGQIRGDGWVVGVLKDLIAYSEHRDLDDVKAALEKAHQIAVRSILH